MKEYEIFIEKLEAKYPEVPFNPEREYPELKKINVVAEGRNSVYSSIRKLIINMGLDRRNVGKASWNPFSDLVKKGGTVVIKPNFVISKHRMKQEFLFSAVTHPSVLRPLIDYSFLAVGRTGKIIIGDSPLNTTVLEELLECTGTNRMIDYLRKKDYPLELVDFRDVFAKKEALVIEQIRLKGDPRGYSKIDLGSSSELTPISNMYEKYRSTAGIYENVVLQHHDRRKNIYNIANSVIQSDLFINVPKLKTHCKAGITVSLKNLIGITNEKRMLPHHRAGTPREGGDMTADFSPAQVKMKNKFVDFVLTNKFGKSVLKLIKPVRGLIKRLYISTLTKEAFVYEEGSWYGNDTIWRTILDLNKVLLYSNKRGKLQKKRRKCLIFVDGVIGGEREGPLIPTPISSGVILGGINPVAIDYVSAMLMGFDPSKIPTIKNAFNTRGMKLCNFSEYDVRIANGDLDEYIVSFMPSAGWRGHIEGNEWRRFRDENKSVHVTDMGKQLSCEY
ncbi:MAG: DUF362 domain-containing protein [Candidatus Bathyarchaeia archaeon]